LLPHCPGAGNYRRDPRKTKRPVLSDSNEPPLNLVS
jgi:hypothetical protein